MLRTCLRRLALQKRALPFYTLRHFSDEAKQSQGPSQTGPKVDPPKGEPKFAQGGPGAQDPKKKRKTILDDDYNEKEEDDDPFGDDYDDDEGEEKLSGKGVKIANIIVWGGIAWLVAGIIERRRRKKNPDKEYKYIPVLEEAKVVADRICGGIESITDILTKPAVDKLMADLPKEYTFVKTIVLNLGGTVIHSDYKMGSGFEIQKRPGIDYLLSRFSRRAEIVIFSDEDQAYLMDVIGALDPKRQFFSGAFGREYMKLYKGRPVKDLKYLNRNLKNIVVIDVDLQKLPEQPDNAILVPKFEGDPDDRVLYDLVPFLEHLIDPKISDVRKEIEHYGSSNGFYKYGRELRQKRNSLEDQTYSGIGSVFRNEEASSAKGRNFRAGKKNFQ